MTPATVRLPDPAAALPPPFRAPYAPADEVVARGLFASAALAPEAEARVDALTRDLVGAIRAAGGGFGGVDELLREYSLSTKEGLALMVLAEALLRVPDAATADRLVEDKLASADFPGHVPGADAAPLVAASAWALALGARVVRPGETPEGVLAGLAKRVGLPAVRAAARRAVGVMGSHFVLGRTIGEALERAGTRQGRVFRYSFDMLGEGARTAADAGRYLASYADAIEAIGRAAGNAPLPDRPGISVKLSALHPRYEALGEARVLRELVPTVLDLARAAKRHELNFTVDAEEADRLELSLDVIRAVAADPSLQGWEGFGLAIQAYGKRARGVVAWTGELAEGLDRRFMVRLVKGAYWDTEVKRAQERGLPGYPVLTRKAMTDLNYLACAGDLLDRRDRLYPQFATHNALTVASIVDRGGEDGYEFQRLHGMGEALYRRLIETRPGLPCRTYAPVGGHRDLLAYLVRRLLENGANSSFVSAAADTAVPVEELLRRPAEIVGSPERASHPRLRAPAALYAPERENSAGVELGHAASREALLAEVAAGAGPASAAPMIDGREGGGAARPVVSPTDARTIAGEVAEADEGTASAAVEAARRGFPGWSRTPVAARATCLERAADALEARRGRFLHLLQLEGGKTLDDALAELREAVDFLRYYAARARADLPDGGTHLPGPTGEENRLTLRGRGPFACIAPWNFPLAIFVGQVAAALAAGNAVVAKPAPQTPLVAAEAVRLLHAAGVPATALHLLPGGPAAGAALVAHPALAGVAFTGSTATARAINRALAAKDGPIVPLIAETGGINAMIVDATALPEQVADDVVTSAFRSAGQRCSALRLLLVQEDVADKMIEMIAGAARELRLGDPRDPSVHLGPAIDAEAKARLDAHIARMSASARTLYAGEVPGSLTGHFVAPHAFELARAEDLGAEVFGPVLHVARWRAGELEGVLDGVEGSGYGLTLGVHSRIDATLKRVLARLPVGNVYVNRNMIGAVVGTQPFGGSGLSGTGPKAGGPHYLPRFALEQTVTINTAAAGGDAALAALEE